MNNNLNSNIIKVSITFAVAFTLIMGVFYAKTYVDDRGDRRNNIVMLNEIEELTTEIILDARSSGEQITSEADTEKLHTAISELQNSIIKEMRTEDNSNLRQMIASIYIAVMLFILLVFVYIYTSVVKPFNKLNNYAAEISKGNMDIPLEYERNNMFGAFTWAFDNMRCEIKKARSCEKEAIENNKTVIATISHDIKTPIASIRAYSEALQAGMDHNMERRERYTSVIISKCDEVSRLTNDLFLHSLADLDKLKMNMEEYPAKQLMEEILSGIQIGDNRVAMSTDIPDTLITVDARRLEQVYENLIGNAVKYAGQSKIEVTHEDSEEYI
ncbi:MAG: HAMP domain-containing sensor histidine kinase, partial [Mobilitalea sp.]